MSVDIDVARDNLQRYGDYPFAMTFANNDNVEDVGATVEPTYSAAYDANEGIKRHAACDECRKRKLKCSGEPTACARCIKQSLVCHYSEQKQMGRPRKRQKTNPDPPLSATQALSPPRPIQPAPEVPRDIPYNSDLIDPSLAAVNDEQSQFESICGGAIAQTVRSQMQKSLQGSRPPGLTSNNSDTSHSQNGIPTPDLLDPYPASYPTDVAQWPDFSTLDMLPIPVDDKYKGFESHSDPDVNPGALSNLPSVPACPCLPNLYLTLSTMSTLSSFPFTPQTVQTIETAYLTARGVIYCSVCPQKFNTGSSNLMLGCTLLNVLADQWNRLRRLGVDELRKSFGSQDQHSLAVTVKEGDEWRAYSNQLLRAFVFGDHSVPSPPRHTQSHSHVSAVSPSSMHASVSTVPPITLMSLCDALTRRQRQWHRLDEASDEFPDRVSGDLTQGHLIGHNVDHPGKYLCLEIVDHARCIIKSLEKPLHH